MQTRNEQRSESFSTIVKEIVRKIPRGSTMTYAEVALAAGKPNAARAVANVMTNNYAIDIPCHRVIRSNGEVGGYNRGGEQTKRNLLQREGVVL